MVVPTAWGLVAPIFDMFFGGGGGRKNPNAPRQGASLEYQLEIDFVDAVFGKEVDLTIPPAGRF